MTGGQYEREFDPGNLALVDLMIRAEARLERRAAALAMVQPKILAETSAGWAPEVDQAAIRFFQKFEKARAEILKADNDRSIELARSCCGPGFWLIMETIDQQSAETYDMSILAGGYKINSYDAAQSIISEITAARAARKAIRWVEQSGILAEGLYHG